MAWTVSPDAALTRAIQGAEPCRRSNVSGEFTQTLATVKWSGRSDDFEFRSDPGSEIVRRAEVSEEHNGVFFT